MSINFRNFPIEIRKKIYEYLLVPSEPIFLELGRVRLKGPVFCSTHHVRRGIFYDTIISNPVAPIYTSILLTDRKTYSEGIALLYSRNRFAPQTQKQLADPFGRAHPGIILDLFFDSIGPQNVAQLRHICLDFPLTDHEFNASKELEKGIFHTLEPIRDRCTNLITLEMSLEIHDYNWFMRNSRRTFEIPAMKLALLDKHLKTIPSLKEIVVSVEYPEFLLWAARNLYTFENEEDRPRRDPKESFTGYGWTIKDKILEEWERAIWDRPSTFL